MTEPEDATRDVGPVLIAGATADAVVAAIQAENSEVHARGGSGYVRVSVAVRCRVSRVAIERALGRAFLLPRDLEAIMPAFKGKLQLNADWVSWEH